MSQLRMWGPRNSQVLVSNGFVLNLLLATWKHRHHLFISLVFPNEGNGCPVIEKTKRNKMEDHKPYKSWRSTSWELLPFVMQDPVWVIQSVCRRKLTHQLKPSNYYYTCLRVPCRQASAGVWWDLMVCFLNFFTCTFFSRKERTKSPLEMTPSITYLPSVERKTRKESLTISNII